MPRRHSPVRQGYRHDHSGSFTSGMIEHAENQGMAVSYKKRFVTSMMPEQAHCAHFVDGTTAEGDFIIGADGIARRYAKSRYQKPRSPSTRYDGARRFQPCIGDASYGPRSNRRTHFIFGQNGFFGYFNVVTPKVPALVWWSTAAAPLKAERRWRQLVKPMCSNACCSPRRLGRTGPATDPIRRGILDVRHP